MTRVPEDSGVGVHVVEPREQRESGVTAIAIWGWEPASGITTGCPAKRCSRCHKQAWTDPVCNSRPDHAGPSTAPTALRTLMNLSIPEPSAAWRCCYDLVDKSEPLAEPAAAHRPARVPVPRLPALLGGRPGQCLDYRAPAPGSLGCSVGTNLPAPSYPKACGTQPYCSRKEPCSGEPSAPSCQHCPQGGQRGEAILLPQSQR